MWEQEMGELREMGGGGVKNQGEGSQAMWSRSRKKGGPWKIRGRCRKGEGERRWDTGWKEIADPSHQ